MRSPHRILIAWTLLMVAVVPSIWAQRNYELNFDIQAIRSSGATLKADNPLFRVHQKYDPMAIGSAMYLAYYLKPQWKVGINIAQYVMKSKPESHQFRMTSLSFRGQYLFTEDTFTPFLEAAVGMGHCKFKYKTSFSNSFLHPLLRTYDGYDPQAELGTGLRINLLGDSFSYVGAAYRYIFLRNAVLNTAASVNPLSQNNTMTVKTNIGMWVFSGGLIMRW